MSGYGVIMGWLWGGYRVGMIMGMGGYGVGMEWAWGGYGVSMG